MTPERWKKLEAIFQEAIALQAEARAAYLADACGGGEQLLADEGKRKEAEEHTRLAIEAGEGSSPLHHAAFSIACAYALMGKNRTALEWLEKTSEQGMPCYPLFDTEPALNGMRGDPQFKAFLEKLKKKFEGYLLTLQ
jgi:hypothetical protein